jgi:hypothetical protein
MKDQLELKGSEDQGNKTTLRLDAQTEAMLLAVMKAEQIPTKVKAVTHFIHRYKSMKDEIANLIKELNQLKEEHREMYETIAGFTELEEKRTGKLISMDQIKDKHKEQYKRRSYPYPNY